MDEKGIWFVYQLIFCRFFQIGSKCLNQGIYLSRDIYSEDSKWLTWEVSEGEVWQAVKQTRLRNPRDRTLSMLFLIRNTGVFLLRQFIV